MPAAMAAEGCWRASKARLRSTSGRNSAASTIAASFSGREMSDDGTYSAKEAIEALFQEVQVFPQIPCPLKERSDRGGLRLPTDEGLRSVSDGEIARFSLLHVDGVARVAEKAQIGPRPGKVGPGATVFVEGRGGGSEEGVLQWLGTGLRRGRRGRAQARTRPATARQRKRMEGGRTRCFIRGRSRRIQSPHSSVAPRYWAVEQIRNFRQKGQKPSSAETSRRPLKLNSPASLRKARVSEPLTVSRQTACALDSAHEFAAPDRGHFVVKESPRPHQWRR